MTWNWQQPDWPDFHWESHLLRKAEAHFLLGAGELAGALKHLPLGDRQHLTVAAISGEAVTTSEIEGEILDRASVQSSVRRAFGLDTGARRVKPAEQGIAEMMVDLYRSYAEPLSDERLFSWHKMLMKGRPDLRDVARYRQDTKAMQIVSGPVHIRKVHFEAPPSKHLRREMKQFISWFNRTSPGGAKPLPALARAGTAHLYFESIHPFEDGNGRIGRAISEKALAQGSGQPSLTALATTILARRKAYYQELGKASRENEVTLWLKWFAGIAIEAQRRTAARMEFLLDKTRLLDRLRGRLNPRQEKALLRMLREGPEGFQGGLSAGNYSTITLAAPATVTRDLSELVAIGALTRTGERRHTRYFLNLPSRPIATVTLDDRGNFV
jgi:Fic family protein